MTFPPNYHEPFAAVPPEVVAAIEEQCGMPIEDAVEKYGGQPILCDGGHYVSIADPPGCGPEHFAAKAEVYRLLFDRQDRARRVAAPVKPTRKPRIRVRPPDGLLTPAEAAAKLGCSIKTLFAHVAAGALRYVDTGRGTKRPRRKFHDPDLDTFISNQTRKDAPCPSTKTKTVARRTSTTTSGCEVIGFTARRNARRAAKPKK